MIKSIVGFFTAPKRYKTLKKMYLQEKSKAIQLESKLKKSESELMKNGVQIHFFEENVEDLKTDKKHLLAEISRIYQEVDFKNPDIYVVMYDHHDYMEPIYVGHNGTEAVQKYSENKLYDLYLYRGGVMFYKKSH
jgi:hypothetical protein